MESFFNTSLNTYKLITLCIIGFVIFLALLVYIISYYNRKVIKKEDLKTYSWLQKK
jgi:uncharacterized membrane-anchored protein